MRIIRLQEVEFQVAVNQAARTLQKGGVVLFPTDTLYGLAVDATNPRALATLRELKGREKKKPISIIVPSVESISMYGEMNDRATQIATSFLPGALTLVVPATSAVPSEITLCGAIGIRIPDDPFCLALAQVFKKPFTATSANKSGRETAATVDGVLAQFAVDAHHIDLVIDDGERKGGVGSTVVRVLNDSVDVLREGVLSKEELRL